MVRPPPNPVCEQNDLFIKYKIATEQEPRDRPRSFELELLGQTDKSPINGHRDSDIDHAEFVD